MMKFVLKESKIAIHIESDRYYDDILPYWFTNKLGFLINRLFEVKRKQKSAPILELIHNPSNRDTDVASFSKLTGIKAFQSDASDMPAYVRIHLSSVKEAKTLALLIAILSARYLRSTDFFIKIMSTHQMLKC